MLMNCLERAKKQVQDGDIRILKQKELVVALAAAGLDTSDAERDLRDLEDQQERHLAEIERILDALDKMPL